MHFYFQRAGAGALDVTVPSIDIRSENLGPLSRADSHPLALASPTNAPRKANEVAPAYV